MSRPATLSDLMKGLQQRLSGEGVPPFVVHLPDGQAWPLGRPGVPVFDVSLRTEQGLQALASLDEATVGLAYLNGDIDIEGDFLTMLDVRASLSDRHPLESFRRFLRPRLLGQVHSNKRWVPQHYDIGNDFYFAFLDKRHRLYSQALYTHDNESLEQAAENKLRYIVEACLLGPGSRVLEVGGGWGSFGRFAAGLGIDVTMLTISHEQFALLSAMDRDDLSGTLSPVYADVFDFSPGERYDAVVLLGVMEHLPDYIRLFRKFEQLLRLNGRVYMDFSANRRKFNVSTFTHRYVFPGNHTPVVVPDLFDAGNRTSFEPIALHNDRHSYFLTLQSWARNLEAAQQELVSRFGESTFRLFQLYLWAGAHQLHRGQMESYRVLFQRSAGQRSTECPPRLRHGMPAPGNH